MHYSRFVALLIFSLSMESSFSQVSFTFAARSGYIIVPGVSTGEHDFSLGAMVSADWLNKRSKCRKIEISYDRFYLQRQVFRGFYSSPGTLFYSASLLRFAYGMRKYITAPNRGLYTEFNMGLMVGYSDGLGSSTDNLLGFAANISPGVGYAGMPFNLGIQLQLAADPSGLIIYPVINAGFHLIPAVTQSNPGPSNE